MVDDDREVTATFIASSKETTSSITGLTVGDKLLRILSLARPITVYPSLHCNYSKCWAQTTGYQVTVQQASADNGYQASVF